MYEEESDEDEEPSDPRYMNARDYNTYLDIISAYKNLKQSVNKPTTMHGASKALANKGYLKMTIAA